MRETIGWIEQEPNNGKAFFCWRADDGRKVEWEIVSFTTRPPSGGGGGKHHHFPWMKEAA